MCFVRWRHLWEEDLKYEAVTSLGRKERSKSQGLGDTHQVGIPQQSEPWHWLPQAFVIFPSPPWLISPGAMAWYHLSYPGTAVCELDLGTPLSSKTNPERPGGVNWKISQLCCINRSLAGR